MVEDAAILVPPGNAYSLSNAIIHLLSSETEGNKLGAAARIRALERFDTKKNAERIETFYRRIMNK